MSSEFEADCTNAPVEFNSCYLCFALFVVRSHLFVKLSWSGDSEEIFSVFQSSCHLLYLPSYSSQK